MASGPGFQPHGLVKTRLQQQFYNKAHISNTYTGIADPKEHETVALMENILYRNIFTEDYFAVTSEQPPSSTSKRHCDLVIKYLRNESDDISILCFAECKRSKTSQAFSLHLLEQQAVEYCTLYLEESGDPFVYAATMAGAHIRLWKCMQGSKGYALMPSWGQNHVGDWQEYKDVGNEEDAQLVGQCFEEMKRWPPNAHAGQTDNTYYSTVDVSSYSAIEKSLGHVEPYEYPAEASSRHEQSAEAMSSFSPLRYGNPDDISWNQFTKPLSGEINMMDDERGRDLRK